MTGHYKNIPAPPPSDAGGALEESVELGLFKRYSGKAFSFCGKTIVTIVCIVIVCSFVYAIAIDLFAFELPAWINKGSVILHAGVLFTGALIPKALKAMEALLSKISL